MVSMAPAAMGDASRAATMLASPGGVSDLGSGWWNVIFGGAGGGRSEASRLSRGHDRGAGAAEAFFVFPGSAAAGLPGDHQVEAGDEREELPARARLEPGVHGDAATGGTAFGGQFPAVGKGAGRQSESEFLAGDGVGGGGGFADEPAGHDLARTPFAVAEQAVADAGQGAGGQAQTVRYASPALGFSRGKIVIVDRTRMRDRSVDRPLAIGKRPPRCRLRDSAPGSQHQCPEARQGGTDVHAYERVPEPAGFSGGSGGGCHGVFIDVSRMGRRSRTAAPTA